MRLFRFRFEDGAKCGGCNWETRDLYVLADTREEAKDLLRRGKAGLCADCMCELLSGEHPSSGKERYIIQVGNGGAA
jgi:hypothetical protein